MLQTPSTSFGLLPSAKDRIFLPSVLSEKQGGGRRKKKKEKKLHAKESRPQELQRRRWKCRPTARVDDLLLGHVAFRRNSRFIVVNIDNFCLRNIFERLKMYFFVLYDLEQGHMTLKFCMSIVAVDNIKICFHNFAVKPLTRELTFLTLVKVKWLWKVYNLNHQS